MHGSAGQKGLRWLGVLVVSVLVVTACSGSNDGGSGSGNGENGEAGPTTDAPSDAADPRYGGTIIGYNSSGPLSTDPNQDNNINSQQGLNNVFNMLVRVDPERLPDQREFIGDLAVAWDESDDMTTFTFELRQGVRFHDGEPFTAEDVRATIERVRDAPDGIASPFQAFFVDATVEVLDTHSVEITFPDPTPLVYEILAQPTMGIVPAHIVEQDQHALEDHPIGTGPFKFVSWQRGVAIEFERNEDYWDDDKPYVDGIRFLDVPEPEAQVSAFLSGRVNITGTGARGLSASDVRLVESQLPGVTVQEYFAATHALIIMNTQRAPFDDVRVRRAVALTMDQGELIAGAMDDAGFRTDFSGPIGKDWSLSESEVSRFPSVGGVTEAHREEARALLAEAGYPDGLEVELLVGSLYETFAPIHIEQLRAIGITARARVLPFGPEFVPETRAGNFDIAYATIPAGIYHPASMMAPFTTGNPDNRMGYSNPEVDDLFEQLSRSTDAGEQQELADRIQEILWEDLPAVPAPLLIYFFALRPEVQGWTDIGILKDNMRWDTVWIDD